jgi:hypothetical protein
MEYSPPATSDIDFDVEDYEPPPTSDIDFRDDLRGGRGMSYSPPATSDINFDVESYLAPATSDINFEVGEIVATGTGAATLGAVTLSGAGSISVLGSGAATLDDLVLLSSASSGAVVPPTDIAGGLFVRRYKQQAQIKEEELIVAMYIMSEE